MVGAFGAINLALINDRGKSFPIIFLILKVLKRFTTVDC